MNKSYSIIPRSLTIIFNEDDSQVLLIKGQPKKTHWANTYNALGGHIEANENIHSSALREVEEESGISLQREQLRLAGLVHVKDYNDDYAIMFLFKATVDDTSIKSSEEGNVEWIDISRLKSIETIAPDIKTLAPLCKKLKNNELIFGTSIFNNDRTLKEFKIDVYQTK